MSRNTVVPLILFAFLATLSSNVSAYKILVIFATGSYSHQRSQQVVSEALAEAGHQVTVITANPIETTNPNITQIDVSFTYEYAKLLDLSGAVTPYSFLNMLTALSTKITEGLLNHPPVANIFKNVDKVHYDAILGEAVPYFPLYMAKEIYNATYIGLSTMELMPMMHKAIGNVIHPILHPCFFIDSPKNPTLWDRIQMVYYEMYQVYWEKYELFPTTDALIKKYFPQTKTTTETLVRSFDLTIEGVTPVLGNVRPLLPNTVQIGFLHIKEAKPCPAPLQKYLDESKTGVIYVSFGSNVKSANLKPEIRKNLMDTFKRLEYDVLWKYENETIVGKPDNVRIEKWLPQQDVLAHKNIKLFIMQGGLQSMEETIDRGVPVIVIPFFADQAGNADKIEALGIGKKLNIEDLTVESFESTIMELISNPKYKTTVKQLGDRIRDTMMPPVKSAVWWIEYAIRNRGADHLKYKGANVSFFEYYLLDVILVHIAALILVLYIIKKICSTIWFKIVKSKKHNNKKLKKQ